MKLGVFYDHVCEAAVQEQLSIPEVLTKVKQAGVSGIEFGMDYLAENPAAVRDMLETQGLETASIYGMFDFGRKGLEQKAMELVKLAVFMGAKKVLVVPGFLQKDSDRYEEMLEMVLALQGLVEYATQNDIAVTMEDFDEVSAPYGTSEELLWFYEQVPGLKITFDTGNFMYRGEDEMAAYKRLRDTIAHVHSKDRALSGKENKTAKKTVTGIDMFPSVVGSGCIKLKALCRELAEDGYDDYISIEQFGVARQLQGIMESASWLQKTLKEVESKRGE